MSRTHPNLVGHWRFEDNLLDASGNGNNGTVGEGSAAYAAGRFSRAWSNDDTRYVDLGNPSSLRITGPLTMGVWANIAGGQPTRQGIVAKIEFDGNNRSWGLHYTAGGVLEFFINGTGLAGGNRGAGSTITTFSGWAHFVGVFRPGQAVELWKDGVLIASNTTSIPETLYDSSMPVLIGAYSDAGTDRRFQGLIDDVRIYNAALSAVDIRHVMIGQQPQRRYA
jgi:hypothetical protein